MPSEIELSEYNSEQQKVILSDEPNILVRAAAGSGKALLNGTKVLTVQGWKSIENITIQDQVFGEDGLPHAVLGVFPQGLKQIWEIEFSDRNIIQCSGDHLWNFQTKSMRDRHSTKWMTETTEQISHRELKRNNAWQIYLPESPIVQYSEQETPIDPYLIGVLLGDGGLSRDYIGFTCAEEDLKQHVAQILEQYDSKLVYTSKYDYRISGPLGFGYHGTQSYLGATLTKLGLRPCTSTTKFIPDIYKYNSEAVRIAILQGLMDTDGSCLDSHYDITLKSRQLILDIQEICESLGFSAVYSEKRAICSNSKDGAKDCGIVYRLYIKTSKKYPKIHTTINKDSRWAKGQSAARRTVRDIRQTDHMGEMTCIAIDSPSHLYLTEHFIPTHNTHALIGAVLQYRRTHPKERIDVITFTRAATAELRNRLAAQGVTDVNISTIHVWARTFLGIYAALYNFQLRVIYEPEVREILRRIVADYHKKVEIEAIYKFICDGMRSNIPERVKVTYEALERRYIKYKRENDLYDFTDYPLYLYDILMRYDEYIMDVDALFVDELQDIDYEQSFVFNRVKARKKFYIGDEKQMIYAFRGASPDIFDRMQEGFYTYQLLNNYRSYQEIINLASSFYSKGLLYLEMGQKFNCSDISWGDPSDISCVRGTGGQVWVANPFGEVWLTDSDGQLKPSNIATLEQFINRRPMILCRTNRMVNTIKQAGYLQVSTIHQAKGLEYDNVILIDSEVRCIDDLNVMYVGETRARDGLYIASLPQVVTAITKSSLFLL